jgi:glycosyltransferase involved in cell wall biosynthesis
LQGNQINTHPSLEIARMLLPKLGFSKFVQHEVGWASVDAVYHSIDKATAKRLANLKSEGKVNAVYAYEDGALASFTRAKELGLQCIYDLPIAYWQTVRKLMEEEAERLPLWANTLGGGIIDSQAKLERKTRELELADVVVYPGKFVGDSLPGWAKQKKQIMSPFGSPHATEIVNLKEKYRRGNKDRPLRILFAGSMGQRKGLGDLFAAMRLLNSDNFELVVMGSLRTSMEFYRSEFPGFRYEAGRPHPEVLALMRSCDLFCLPSIVEGRALVMQEAMSQGLPLIITPNTGGEDLIIEGRTGFLVPIRSPEKIAEKLNWFQENRSAIPEMGEFAREHASRYTWERYGAKIIEDIIGI